LQSEKRKQKGRVLHEIESSKEGLSNEARRDAFPPHSFHYSILALVEATAKLSLAVIASAFRGKNGPTSLSSVNVTPALVFSHG
jgi:hypothetical protein